MPTIAQKTRLDHVEHILGSGTGTLDFAIEGESGYYTWYGAEDADWEVDDVATVENAEEDRFLIYPEADYFTCVITADGEEHNSGPVRCWCE
jgi:hypothetical protein